MSALKREHCTSKLSSLILLSASLADCCIHFPCAFLPLLSCSKVSARIPAAPATFQCCTTSMATGVDGEVKKGRKDCRTNRLRCVPWCVSPSTSDTETDSWKSIWCPKKPSFHKHKLTPVLKTQTRCTILLELL